ncbi:MAG: Flp family type IVb pilin [Rhizobiaceae bacterium]|nr:Flp family type IVb pilin [Rhizobiaceae bacterium]
MKKTLEQFLRDESGVTAIEYGLIVAVLSLVIVGGIGKVAEELQYLWGDNNSRLQQGLQSN